MELLFDWLIKKIEVPVKPTKEKEKSKEVSQEEADAEDKDKDDDKDDDKEKEKEQSKDSDSDTEMRPIEKSKDKDTTNNRKRKRKDFEDKNMKDYSDSIRTERFASMGKSVAEKSLEKEERIMKEKAILASQVAETLLVLENTFLRYEVNGEVDVGRWWAERDYEFVEKHFETINVTKAMDQMPIILCLLRDFQRKREVGFYTETIKKLKRMGVLPQNWVDYYGNKLKKKKEMDAIVKEAMVKLDDNNNNSNNNSNNSNNSNNMNSMNSINNMNNNFDKFSSMDLDEKNNDTNEKQKGMGRSVGKSASTERSSSGAGVLNSLDDNSDIDTSDLLSQSQSQSQSQSMVVENTNDATNMAEVHGQINIFNDQHFDITESLEEDYENDENDEDDDDDDDDES